MGEPASGWEHLLLKSPLAGQKSPQASAWPGRRPLEPPVQRWPAAHRIGKVSSRYQAYAFPDDPVGPRTAGWQLPAHVLAQLLNVPGLTPAHAYLFPDACHDLTASVADLDLVVLDAQREVRRPHEQITVGRSHAKTTLDKHQFAAE